MCIKIDHRPNYSKMDYSRALFNQRISFYNLNSSFNLTQNLTHHLTLNFHQTFNQNFTQNFTQHFAQSSSLVIRLARLVSDLYYSTIDLQFLIQLFSFNFNVCKEESILSFSNHESDISDQQVNDEKEKRNSDPNKLSFSPSVNEPANLPDIITCHQLRKDKVKSELIDIGRKLRSIAEQFEKQRSN